VRKLADLRNVVALERRVIKSSVRSAMRSETGLQSCAESGDHLQPCNPRRLVTFSRPSTRFIGRPIGDEMATALMAWAQDWCWGAGSFR
jgi:hypothetical protein